MKNYQKARFFCFLSLLVLLSGCDQSPSQETQTKDTNNQIIESTDTGYKTVIPLKMSPIRGITAENTDNYINFNEMDTGLMDISKKYVSPKKYIYQPGSILTADDVGKLLERKSDTNNFALNPEQNSKKTEPLYVNTIVEQDYFSYDENMTDENKNIDTIALGFGIDPNSEINNKKLTISDDEIENYITTFVSSQIATYIRDIKKEDVNIIVGFFKESQDGVLPGNYYTYGYIPKTESKLTNVEKTNIHYEIFPNSDTQKYKEVNTSVSTLSGDIENFFQEYSSLIAIGKYNKDTLEELKIDIRINLYSKVDISALINFINDKMANFNKNIPKIEINIKSNSDENIGLIIYENGSLQTDYIF